MANRNPNPRTRAAQNAFQTATKTNDFSPGTYGQGLGFLAPPAPDPAPAAPVDTGGGGSGGGYTPYDPTTDPTYQAYVANLDMTQQQQQADTARKVADLNAAQSLSLANSASSGEQSRQGISNSYEGRGLYNSGARLNDLAIQQSNQGARESQIKQGTGAQISDLESTLANAVAQIALRRQGAQQGVFS